MREHLEDLWIDANGVPTERVRLGDQAVVVHYDTIPEKDLTIVDGIPCTTALRTVIDLAAEVGTDELRSMVQQCLRRGLFTVEELLARTDEADLRSRAGARLIRRLFCPPA
jgi:hypothetical protein